MCFFLIPVLLCLLNRFSCILRQGGFFVPACIFANLPALSGNIRHLIYRSRIYVDSKCFISVGFLNKKKSCKPFGYWFTRFKNKFAFLFCPVHIFIGHRRESARPFFNKIEYLIVSEMHVSNLSAFIIDFIMIFTIYSIFLPSTQIYIKVV